MAEYIKRESIQKALKNVTDDPSCPLFLAAMIEQYIDQEPAADVVEVKHGKWIKCSVIKCSVCGSCTDIQSDEAYEKFIESYYYCPVCGSKLDLED